VGGAGSLGRAFCLELAKAGAEVLAGDVNAAGLRALRDQAAALPGRVRVDRVDVTDEADVRRFVAAAGPVNVLVNTAGVLRDGVLAAREGGEVRTLALSQWKKLLDVNLTGTFLAAREVVASMIASGTKGVIVNVSSAAHVGNAGQGAYAASKAAIHAASRSWALELAPLGIRVATVAPGVTESDMLDDISDGALAGLRSATPLGRVGRAAEIWAAVRFAIECDFFTGRVLDVDGGASIDAAAVTTSTQATSATSDTSETKKAELQHGSR
jgi:3-oxoacyl-[acyl-carrier protein] reductase